MGPCQPGRKFWIVDTDMNWQFVEWGRTIEYCERRICEIVREQALTDGSCDNDDTYYAPQYKIVEEVKTTQPETIMDIQVTLQEVEHAHIS